MTTQTLHQGSLRPATAIPHPGLQVHSIAAPKTDRRLSFLMSANIYCAMAGVIFLISQTAPDLITKFTNPGKVVDIVLPNPPVEAHLTLAPPTVKTQGLTAQPANIAPIALPNQPGDTDTIPTLLPTQPIGSTASYDPSRPINPEGPSETNATGRDPGPGTVGPVLDVDFKAVRVLQQVQPGYPNLARLAHKEGDVVLLMTINEKGEPTDVQMDSGEPIFKGDALRAARLWRFTPATLNGEAHAARFKLILQFRLRG